NKPELTDLALAALGAGAQADDAGGARCHLARARPLLVHQALVLHAQQGIAHAVGIDAECLADVVEREGPVPVAGTDPTLRLPGEHPWAGAGRAEVLLEAADRGLEDGEH